jgi:hypothetical protein
MRREEIIGAVRRASAPGATIEEVERARRIAKACGLESTATELGNKLVRLGRPTGEQAAATLASFFLGLGIISAFAYATK